jgi:poly(3-hydroxyalkanoate) synthetase
MRQCVEDNKQDMTSHIKKFQVGDEIMNIAKQVVFQNWFLESVEYRAARF